MKVRCPFCKKFRPSYLIRSHIEQCKALHVATPIQKAWIGKPAKEAK